MPRMSAFVTMVCAVAHPRGTRWSAWRIVLLLSVGAGVFLLHNAGVAAEQVAPPESQAHPHTDGQGHDSLAGPGVTGAVRSDAPVRYVMLNVEVSDTGFQPSAVFVPAGQPVRLVLRNRSSTEHHYRVVGLVPDELSWIAAPASTTEEGISDDEHDHHNLGFVRWRATSPAGISPTGDEVHAYVSARGGVDVVLFIATQTGTFVVQCDLHPEKVGKLVVFEGASQPAALVAARENALNFARRNALSIAPGDALSRTGDQVMTLRLDSGQETASDLPSSIGGSWIAPAIFAGGLGVFGLLVWTMAGGRLRRSRRTDVQTP